MTWEHWLYVVFPAVWFASGLFVGYSYGVRAAGRRARAEIKKRYRHPTLVAREDPSRPTGRSPSGSSSHRE